MCKEDAGVARCVLVERCVRVSMSECVCVCVACVRVSLTVKFKEKRERWEGLERRKVKKISFTTKKITGRETLSETTLTDYQQEYDFDRNRS